MSLEEVIVSNLERVAAKDILVYDTKERSPFYDQMILATVDSIRQADSVIAYIEEDCMKEGFSLRKVEGRGSSWVLARIHAMNDYLFTKNTKLFKKTFNVSEDKKI